LLYGLFTAFIFSKEVDKVGKAALMMMHKSHLLDKGCSADQVAHTADAELTPAKQDLSPSFCLNALSFRAP
jgi:hypothetical protein